MRTIDIIAALDSEIQKLTHARNLLNGVDNNPIQAIQRKASKTVPAAPIKKQGMSPEGRKRLADAMRARWAAKKSSAKAIKSVKK